MDRRPNVLSYGNMSMYQKRRSHQLGENQTSTPPMTPGRNVSAAKTPTNSTTTTSDKGKKLLIDQFYNSINETQSSINGINSTSPNVKNNVSSNNSNTDLNNTANSSGNGIMMNSGNSSYSNLRNLFSSDRSHQLRTAEKGDETLLEEAFRQILRQGGAKYQSMDNNLLNDDDLATYLLNFDNIITGEALESNTPPVDTTNHHQPIARDQLKPIERIVTDLTNTMEKLVRKLFLTPASMSSTNVSNLQIERFKNFVLQLQSETSTLANELVANKDVTSKKYHKEVKQNEKKLKDLLTTMELLETRLNLLKSKISSNKSIMSNEIEVKLKTLEYIDKRIIEYTRESKERKLRMVSVILSIAVLLVSIWWSIRVYG